MTEIYYLCGPITDIEDENRPAFDTAAQTLRAMGYEVINPHELHEGAKRQTWEEYMRVDIAEMARRATRVALLQGWRQSRGAVIEHHVAKSLSIICQPIEDVLPPRKYDVEDMNRADAMGHQRGVLLERKRCAGIMNFVMHENEGLGLFTPAQCYQMLQDGTPLEDVEAGKHHETPASSNRHSGAGMILDERVRQIAEEGFSAHDDDRHYGGNLARAAACYAAPDNISSTGDKAEDYWPFDRRWDKRSSQVRPPERSTATPPELAYLRIRELVKAGALCAAEIDRLKRLEKKDG